MTPRVLSEEEWDRAEDTPVYPADACPECHRKPGFHGPDCPILKAALANPPPGGQDALDKDPEGTVAKAKGMYLRALGRDPNDETGLVAKLKNGAYIVAKEAERRRLIRDTEATRAKWDAIAAAEHGPAYDLARSIWYGIPFTGAPELLYPELEDEVALTRGEWLEWAEGHRRAGEESMIDHLASIIPPNPGEEYPEWRERLKRRRLAWSVETDEVVVNKTLFPRKNGESYVEWVRRLRGANPSGAPVSRSPYAPPRPAGPRSPGSSRRRRGRRAARRGAGPGGAPPEPTPR